MLKGFYLAVILASTIAGVAQTPKPVVVKPTVTKTGEVRQGYVRTSPNGTTRDNYSTKGNVNPYTGKEGTKNPNPTPKPKN